MEEKKFHVVTGAGIHARPATLLVQTASKLNSGISLEYKDKSVNLKSVMSAMSLGVGQSPDVTTAVDGASETGRMAAIVETLQKEGSAE